MIIALIGQPHSGKTTLAQELQEQMYGVFHKFFPIVDGDDIRRIFKNKDFSKEGRLKNLNRISDIATYLADDNDVVLVSAVYPLKEAREYLESIHDEVYWVYLTYDKDEQRGREAFHVAEYDVPASEVKKLLILNTSDFSISSCLNKITSYVGKESSCA